MRRTDPVHPPKPPGKKNRALWCRGKVGILHDYQISLPTNTPGDWVCREWSWYEPSGKPHRHWACYHVWSCTKCGKHHPSRRLTEAECNIALASERAK